MSDVAGSCRTYPACSCSVSKWELSGGIAREVLTDEKSEADENEEQYSKRAKTHGVGGVGVDGEVYLSAVRGTVCMSTPRWVVEQK